MLSTTPRPIVFLAFCFALAIVAPTFAQNETPAPKATSGQDAKKDDAKKDDASETAPAAAATTGSDAAASDAKTAQSDPAQTFATHLETWRQLLADMRGLQKQAEGSEPAELAKFQNRWATLNGQATLLLPKLRSSGTAAFAAAPGVDRRLARFLVKLLQDDMRRDAYEQARSLGQALIDGKSSVREIYEHTGLAAYSMHDFEAASALLQQAEELDAITPDGQSALASIEEYKKLWAAEKAIRKKEAEADDLPRVKLTTNRGEIIVELFENEAPETVGNFISLVEGNFYDGLTFHRVLPGFMVQGGCPNGDGRGGPGYKIYCECKADNARMHFRGTLSMAHSGLNTGGSQFFTTFRPTPHLNKRHTVFGRVIEGFDVLSDIRRRNPESPNPPAADVIVKAEVLRKREHPYAANKVQ